MISILLSDFGGKGDNLFDNTDAFKKAFSYLNENNGGRLIVEKGIWKTGPIELFSHTELRLEEGAEISFIPEPDRYQPVWTRWEGVECYGMHPCVFSTGQEDVKITGKGVINGNGQTWWKWREEKRTQKKPETAIELKLASLNPGYENQPGGGGGRNVQFLRPPLVQFFDCKGVRLEDVTIKDSPFWTVHPVFCDNFSMFRVKVCNPHNAPNTDGIDIDSCTNVQIIGCDVSVGDDGICLKSGSGPDGIKRACPTQYVLVQDCTVGDGHGGIVIGSETAAGIDHVLTQNCVFNGTDRGIRIKTRRGRGGNIHHLEFKNLVMKNNLCPFAMNMFYKCGAQPDEPMFSLDKLPINEATPQIHDIVISNVEATGCKSSAGFMAGLPECPITNLTIENSFFTTDENSDASPSLSEMFYSIPDTDKKSFRILFAEKPILNNVTIEGPAETFIYE
ncbi:MAG: glycoside hydrolase family 28 protein [Spirochaetaceae bacterium]|nr:glycoside hydrolase family 28 protein [Spirochaetaceae bacterium]